MTIFSNIISFCSNYEQKQLEMNENNQNFRGYDYPSQQEVMEFQDALYKMEGELLKEMNGQPTEDKNYDYPTEEEVMKFYEEFNNRLIIKIRAYNEQKNQNLKNQEEADLKMAIALNLQLNNNVIQNNNQNQMLKSNAESQNNNQVKKAGILSSFFSKFSKK